MVLQTLSNHTMLFHSECRPATLSGTLELQHCRSTARHSPDMPVKHFTPGLHIGRSF